MSTADGIMTIDDVAKRYDVSTQTIYRWSRDGEMPKPVRVGRRLVRWRLLDLQQWERNRCRPVIVGE